MVVDYNALIQQQQGRIVPLACLTHVRRYSEWAADNDHQRADYAISVIGKLYVLEEESDEASFSFSLEEHYEMR